MLNADQEARLLVAADAHRSLLERAIEPVTGPDDRWVLPGLLERGISASGVAVEVLLAWMSRLAADETLRPLNGDLEGPWPSQPDPRDVERRSRSSSDEGLVD